MTQPADPTAPGANPSAVGSDTGRRNRATRMYSDGFSAVAAGVPEPATETTVVTAVPTRSRPPSQTIIELPQDRAALALPEIAADEVLPEHLPAAEAPTPAARPAVLMRLDSAPPARQAATRNDLLAVVGQTTVGPAPLPPVADQDRKPARGRALAVGLGWLGAALLGALVAWVAPRPAATPARDRPAVARPVAVAPAATPAPAQPQVVAVAAPQPVPVAASAAAVAGPPTRAADPAPAVSDPQPPAQPASVALADPCRAFDHVVAGTASDLLAPHLVLRTAPDAAAPLVAKLNDGTRVRIIASQGQWRRVRVCDRTDRGWVYARWVRPASPQQQGNSK